MPIQRIPRYVLLLEDLAKQTPEDHVDHTNLIDALARMKAIAKLINEKKREAESFTKLVEIYNRLDPPVEVRHQFHQANYPQGLMPATSTIHQRGHSEGRRGTVRVFPFLRYFVEDKR
jgi:hypothetical protein